MQLLDFERIADADRTEKIGREVRDTGELQQLAFGKTVANLHIAVIGQTNDVTRIRFFDLLTTRCHEGHDRGDLDLTI